MEDAAEHDRSFGDFLRQVRAEQEVCDHEWAELGGGELAFHQKSNDIRDDVRVVAVARCCKCLAFRYVSLLLANRRR